MNDAADFIKEEADRVLPDVVGIRRDFHSHPELSFQETRTSDKIDFNYIRGYPAALNDPRFTENARAAAQGIPGTGDVHQRAHPRMRSEDLSYFLEKVPGAPAFLGARPSDREPVPLHSTECAVDEAPLRAGVKVHAAVAVNYLGGKL